MIALETPTSQHPSWSSEDACLALYSALDRRLLMMLVLLDVREWTAFLTDSALELY
jgi:hypothetical protein